MRKRQLGTVLVAAFMGGATQVQAQIETQALAGTQAQAGAPGPAAAPAEAKAPARTPEPAKSLLADRLYVGITAGNLQFDDEHGGIQLSDSSFGAGVLAGFAVNDRLTLELSYDSFDAIDLHNVAGSGVTHFDVETERRTASLSALAQISMKEIFGWRHDWRLFGTFGAYQSDLRRTVTTLGSGAQSSVTDDSQGLLLGGGALYAIGRMELRGYVRSFGILDDGEASELGAAVQLRF